MNLRKTLIGLLFIALPAAALAQGSEMLSLDNATQTLNADFKQPPTWRTGAQQPDAAMKPLSDASFSWAAGYLWNHAMVGTPQLWPLPKSDFPAWTSNTTADADPNGDMIAKISKDESPLTWSGTLNFTAHKMPDDLVATIPKIDPHGYMGASINSFPYAQLYGVFAISAKLPKGKGVWPAFWLLPFDKSWPPEIDVFELLGKDPSIIYTTLHVKGPSISKTVDTHVDLSKDFHEYTVDWGPQQIKWYLDGKQIFAAPTPEELHKPCYILANIGVGKDDDVWGGGPDATTVFPATMQVKYIRAWQRKSYEP